MAPHQALSHTLVHLLQIGLHLCTSPRLVLSAHWYAWSSEASLNWLVVIFSCSAPDAFHFLWGLTLRFNERSLLWHLTRRIWINIKPGLCVYLFIYCNVYLAKVVLLGTDWRVCSRTTMNIRCFSFVVWRQTLSAGILPRELRNSLSSAHIQN